MRMDEGVDTGPVLSQRAIPILPEDTAESLSERLSLAGAELLIETLPGYLSGEMKPQPQDESLATYAPMLKKEDGRLDFNQPATALERRVRAFYSWPGTFSRWQGQNLKILQARAVSGNNLEPGETMVYEGFPAVGTGDGLLVLESVQPAGKKAMAGDVFLNGARDWGKIRLE
jgi:methionyl-tRNA formyltransferase